MQDKTFCLIVNHGQVARTFGESVTAHAVDHADEMERQPPPALIGGG
jgi:hypothetical protein